MAALVKLGGMLVVLAFLFSGCVFGLAGGFTPGPTTALVVAQTVRFGLRDGVKVAIAPLLTDAPIIVVTVVLVGQIARFKPVLGVIALCGAIFLAWLAIVTFKVRSIEAAAAPVKPRSIAKGVLANALNPHPYLFWLMIGAPTFVKARQASLLSAGLFLVGLYVCLVGAKVLIAWLVANSKRFLRSRGYVILNQLLGLALGVYAALFLRDALRFFEVSGAGGWG